MVVFDVANLFTIVCVRGKMVVFGNSRTRAA